jgi:hypothetical protein
LHKISPGSGGIMQWRGGACQYGRNKKAARLGRLIL